MSYLVDFIIENPNWRELLAEKPYCLKIKDDGNYTLFMYNQIDSDFYNPIVKEARGIILDMAGEQPRVVCRAFDKFGNYGEGYADSIDWASAVVQEKVDGSIIKLWFDAGTWHISTNSCIDAFKANLSNSNLTFGKIFASAFPSDVIKQLDMEYTYIFELVSPYNKVVIDYGKDTKIYLLGKRNNNTGYEEIPEDLGLPVPEVYPLSSLEECIEAANALNDSENDIQYEGFVVVDEYFHRVKIKSPYYVARHHVLTKTPSLEDLVLVYLRHEQEEFLTYFPAYTHALNLIYFFFSDLDYFMFKARLDWKKIGDRKEFALKYKNDVFSKFYFDAIKYEDWSIERVKSLPHAELGRIIKNFYGGNI